MIGKDERGLYGWRPELKKCRSQGATLEEEAIANIKEAIELYRQALPADERDLPHQP